MNNLMRLAKLSEQRKALVEAQREYYALRADFDAETRPLKERIAALEQEVSETETNIKSDALSYYERTGNKTPAPGVKVRLLTRLSYDEKEALRWAKEHQLALLLDKKEFERIAMGGGMDFVRVERVPQVTLATDMELALKSGR